MHLWGRSSLGTHVNVWLLGHYPGSSLNPADIYFHIIEEYVGSRNSYMLVWGDRHMVLSGKCL